MCCQRLREPSHIAHNTAYIHNRALLSVIQLRSAHLLNRIGGQTASIILLAAAV